MNQSSTTKILGKTSAALSSAWRDLTGSARVKITGSLRPDLPEADMAELRRRIDACLDGRGGKVTARTKAAELGQLYLGLDQTGKRRFFELLAKDYGVDEDALRAAARETVTATGDALIAAEQQLRDVLSAPRINLLTQFNGLRDGVKFIVDLRADLLTFSRKDPALKPLDRELKTLLASWFDVGFLELRAIDWDSPAALLEKLIAYEAVHEIKSWDDLKNRLDGDRRCYAFFHPKMPDEPLIFVEVALVNGIADNVQHLLDEDAPEVNPTKADSAIFYSISNAQAGLAGVGFGDFLIKRVVADLSGHFPNLKNFCTLSPVPGFRKWLSQQKGHDLLMSSEAYDLAMLEDSQISSPVVALDRLIDRLDDKKWMEDDVLLKATKPVLKRLCLHYLTKIKRSGLTALDPVAHFHLSNGARLERINWMGDSSPKGYQQSAGLMVNYLYKLNDIETNHERYSGEGTVATSL